MVAPMIPVLNDAEMETIMEKGAGAGAVAAGYILLRLPLELKDIFAEWLDAHVPDMAAHVLSQTSETRSGALYVSDFKTRMRGTGQRAELLAQRFKLACKRLGLKGAQPSTLEKDTSQFRPPSRPGDQLALF